MNENKPNDIDASDHVADGYERSHVDECLLHQEALLSSILHAFDRIAALHVSQAAELKVKIKADQLSQLSSMGPMSARAVLQYDHGKTCRCHLCMNL